MSEEIVQILGGLNNKAALKQHIYRNTKTVFKSLKRCARSIVDQLAPQILGEAEEPGPNGNNQAKAVHIELMEVSDFEFHLKFSGDTIAFIMHTNIFTFPPEHEVNKLKYVNDVPERGYFGMIQAYNFLSDSLKYHRMRDLGYLLARFFVNSEGHFYIDGQRQLDFLYKNVAENEVNDDVIIKIIEQTMLYALDFDLYVPPVDSMSEITVEQKNYFNNPSGLATGKRLGFKRN